MSHKLTLKAAAGTHPGRVHDLDQDSAFAYVRPPELGGSRALLVVADGMGGHQAGEVASSLAVESLHKQLAWFLEQDDAEDTQPTLSVADQASEDLDNDTELLEKRLLLALEEANAKITRYAQENPVDAGNLGTTVTAALVDGAKAIIANIGDSRTYLLRDHHLQQITEDHSYVAHLLREGQITREQVYVHPRRNVITRSLGYRPEVEIDLYVQMIRPGDQLLLCSDGLWEMARNDDLLQQLLLEADTPERAVTRLIDMANKHGGADNIGVVVAHVESEET